MLKLYTRVGSGLMLLSALTFSLSLPSIADAAGKKGKATIVKSDAQKSRGEATDPNIKSDSVSNDPSSAMKAPPEKGGESTRGNFCYIEIDNRTPWKIKMYVDGQYVGLVSPWGNSSGTYSAGNHTIYAFAEFVNSADNTTWGPDSISCSGRFVWNLTDTGRGYR